MKPIQLLPHPDSRNIHDQTVAEAVEHENGLTVLGFKFQVKPSCLVPQSLIKLKSVLRIFRVVYYYL